MKPETRSFRSVAEAEAFIRERCRHVQRADRTDAILAGVDPDALDIADEVFEAAVDAFLAEVCNQARAFFTPV